MSETAAAAPTSQPTTTPSAQPQAAPSKPDTPAAEGGERASQETAAEAAIRRHKVKIDGAELEVDEPELVKSYERSKASYKRFEEAAKKLKEVEARERELTETLRMARDPKMRTDALAHLLGGREALERFAQDLIVERLEWDALPEPERKRRSEMTERERKIADEERRISEREAAVKKRREAELAAESERMQAEFVRTWPDMLRKAGAPSSRHAMSRMASVMREALEVGADITPAEAAQRVAEEIRAEVRELASASDPDTLRSLLGDGAEKVRAAQVADVRAQPGRTPPREQPPARREPVEQRRPLTTEELRRKYSR